MSINKHYHVHVCLVRNEQPNIEDALQIALNSEFFLTWDLIVPTTTFADFTRQQIDACDYLIFIIGESYGALSPSGVSYLHLNYIYSATKRVPMAIFIKDGENYSRQRQDLVNLIEKEQLSHVYRFQDHNRFGQDCQKALADLVKSYPKIGWQKFRKISAIPSTESPILAKPVPPAPKAPELPDLQLPTFNKAKDERKNPILENLQKITRQDNIIVGYSAHAYQGGNLKEITATYTFTWQQILDMLDDLREPFSTEMMQKTLNDSLKQSALIEAQKTMLNVHAVSRCLINAMDFQLIKQQLIANGWITPVKDERSNRETWQVSK